MQVFDYECCTCYRTGSGMTRREEETSGECSLVGCGLRAGLESGGWIRKPILRLYRGDEWFSKGRFGRSWVVRLGYRGGGDESRLGELGSIELLVELFTGCIHVNAFGRLETYQGRKIVSKSPGCRCLMDCKQQWPRHFRGSISYL